MEYQEYTNPFTDVHRKAKAFKDRARDTNKNEDELRASRLVQEAKEMLTPRRQIVTGTKEIPEKAPN